MPDMSPTLSLLTSQRNNAGFKGATMKTIFGAVLAWGALSATCISASAATLDDVMARLESMQRDNQAIRRDNDAMRKELSALRKNEPRPSQQIAVPENAPRHQLSPAAASAKAAVSPNQPHYKTMSVTGPYNWSGFYLGAHIGYGWGRSNWNTTTVSGGGLAPGVGDQLSQNPSGLLGGIQGGANQQFGRAVVGIEASISGTGLSDSAAGELRVFGVPAGITTVGKTEVNWLGTVTGRVGYAFDNILLYAKGGIAAGSLDNDYLIVGGVTPSGKATDTRFGWTAGGGAEIGLTNNWSVKAEYNYIDFGDSDTLFSLTGAPPAVFIQNIKTDFHLVTFGVNYRFSGN